MHKNQRKGFAGIKLLSVMVNGAAAKIAPSTISSGARTLHHGEYQGVKVNSPASCKFGDSVILWPEAGKSEAVSMSKAAAAVFCKQYLESEGHTVTLKQ